MTVEHESCGAGGGDQHETDEAAHLLTLQEQIQFAYHVHHYMTQQVQFADLKASGVLVAAGALLAYIVTVVAPNWRGFTFSANIGGLALAIIGMVALAASIVASLLCVWPRVWKSPEDEEGFSLFDFRHCSGQRYAERLGSTTRERVLAELADGAGRHAAVAAFKHGLMRFAIVLTFVGGVAALALMHYTVG